MGIAADAVVVAKVTDVYEFEVNGVSRLRTQFELKERVKGDISSVFDIQSLNLKIGDLTRTIEGEPTFQIGETYLLFLHKASADYWRPWMFAHAIFRQWEYNNQTLLAPLSDGLNFQVINHPSGRSIDPLRVYPSRDLVQELRSVVNQGATWNGAAIDAGISLDVFIDLEARNGGSLPSHCTFLSSTPYARWANISTSALDVYSGNGGDVGCSNWAAQVSNAISAINTSYPGLSLNDAGTHSFEPTCSGEGATDSEFLGFVNSNYGNQSISIQFDDPCSEIADLSGCSGTLAIGGLYWFGSTHQNCGETWRNAAYGYVIVNNGTGACQCPSTDYEIMITHELTHSLNIGHIASGNGAANMNPSCCNTIQTLDQDCLEYIYPSAVLPVELVNFAAEVRNEEVFVSWQTASELHNDYFEIQRSVDGVNFEYLERVEGSGSSQEIIDYSVMDVTPLKGRSFYRLKQVDYDGTSIYSEVKSVYIDYEDWNTTIFPNPITGGEVQFSIDSKKERETSIEVLTLDGKLVQSKEFNIVRGSNRLGINLDGFPSGVYFLSLQSDTGIVSMYRFVKP